MLSEFELGWLVGILEGEGYFGYERGTCRVIVGMTDEDTIHRVAGLLERVLNERVNIREEAPRPGRTEQQMYRISITGKKARQVMRHVVHHMSFRRRQKIWQALNGYTSPNVKLSLVNLGLAKGS